VFDFLKDNWKLIFAIVTGPIGLIVLYVTTHWGKIKSTIVNGFNDVITILSPTCRDTFLQIGVRRHQRSC
jgi:phage-related protein